MLENVLFFLFLCKLDLVGVSVGTSTAANCFGERTMGAEEGVNDCIDAGRGTGLLV
jgi:hypothetical protein